MKFSRSTVLWQVHMWLDSRKPASIHNWNILWSNYHFEVFYLGKQSRYLYEICHNSIVLHSRSMHQLLNGLNWPSFQIVFADVVNTTSIDSIHSMWGFRAPLLSMPQAFLIMVEGEEPQSSGQRLKLCQHQISSTDAIFSSTCHSCSYI